MGDHTKIVVWQRKQPDLNLVELIDQKKVAMLFPSLPSESNEIVTNLDAEVSCTRDLNNCGQKTELKDFDRFIIVDATWQEARKIYNRSAYLQRAIKISLVIDQPSVYCKRRNQIEGGLSTAECAIAVLKQKDELALAAELQQSFNDFNFS